MFIKARKRATIGYLNLCIALQKIRRRQLHRKLIELQSVVKAPGGGIMCGGEAQVLQINGIVISSYSPITVLEGETIKQVVIVPGKLINLITQ